MTDITKSQDFIEAKQKFDAYYDTVLQPILEKSNRVRWRYNFAFVTLILMSLVLYPTILYLLLASNIKHEYLGLVLSGSCLLVILLCGPLYYYKKKVKPQIMPDFANFFGTFSYSYEGKISDALLRQSDLFGAYTLNVGDDYFSGTFEDVRITVAEEKLLEIKKDFCNFDIKKEVFGGVCILFEMNKNFKGRTVVLKDRGIIGNAINKVNGLQNVKLEDSRFEKVFEVYSDDQIEARYLLTTAFMERMLKLRDLYEGKSIQFCFDNNTLLLAIPTKQNMFEANSFFGSNADKKRVDLVFEQFYTVFSIVKLLKLNQRIGM
ncbi:MAG: DUF3137 domain-containing protein [Alphaproteobacteria bacterium]|nr:DUF3137 domain-containing protein [Alphaproteobacteria bacterium]